MSQKVIPLENLKVTVHGLKCFEQSLYILFISTIVLLLIDFILTSDFITTMLDPHRNDRNRFYSDLLLVAMAIISIFTALLIRYGYKNFLEINKVIFSNEAKFSFVFLQIAISIKLLISLMIFVFIFQANKKVILLFEAVINYSNYGFYTLCLIFLFYFLRFFSLIGRLVQFEATPLVVKQVKVAVFFLIIASIPLIFKSKLLIWHQSIIIIIFSWVAGITIRKINFLITEVRQRLEIAYLQRSKA